MEGESWATSSGWDLPSTGKELWESAREQLGREVWVLTENGRNWEALIIFHPVL